MRSLVTGANGFLGVVLVKRLLELDAGSVRCLVRPGSSRERLLSALEAHPGGEMVEGSLGSPGAVAPALEGVDVVFHLASPMRGAPSDMFLGGVVGSGNLLEALEASRRSPRLVLVSSFSVYGAAAMTRGDTLTEASPLEPHPEKRDPYAQVKLRQERLFREYAERTSTPLVVLRPGVIYGPHGPALSGRVGLRLPGLFLHIGGANPLPITYVDNCAEAIAIAGQASEAEGQAYNVHDDELVTARQYLRRFKRQVTPLRSIFVPYPFTLALASVVEGYSRRSRGQLPAFLTPYKVASTWKRLRFNNAKLRGLGWQQAVSTGEGLRQTFEGLRARMASGENIV